MFLGLWVIWASSLYEQFGESKLTPPATWSTCCLFSAWIRGLVSSMWPDSGLRSNVRSSLWIVSCLAGCNSFIIGYSFVGSVIDGDGDSLMYEGSSMIASWLNCYCIYCISISPLPAPASSYISPSRISSSSGALPSAWNSLFYEKCSELRLEPVPIVVRTSWSCSCFVLNMSAVSSAPFIWCFASLYLDL